MSAPDRVLGRLKNVSQEGNSCEAGRLVSAHGQGRGDRNRSLCASESDDGKVLLDKVLLNCRVGCALVYIVTEIGLSVKDLFENPKRNGNGHKTIVATYDYADECGKLIHQIVCYKPKAFRQRRADGNRGLITKRVFDGIRPVFYRLPAIRKTAREGGTV